MPQQKPRHVQEAILSGNTHLLSQAGRAGARKRARPVAATPIPVWTVRFDPTDPIHVRDATHHAMRHKGVGWGDDD